MKKIDDIFKQGISEKGLPYSDSEWAAVESALNGSQKGSGLLSLKAMTWLLGSLLLIGSISWYFIQNGIDDQSGTEAMNKTNQSLNSANKKITHTDQQPESSQTSETTVQIALSTEAEQSLASVNNNAEETAAGASQTDVIEHKQNIEVTADSKPHNSLPQPASHQDLSDEKDQNSIQDQVNVSSTNDDESSELAEQARKKLMEEILSWKLDPRMISNSFFQRFIKQYGLVGVRTPIFVKPTEYQPAKNGVSLELSPFIGLYSTSRRLESSPADRKNSEVSQNAREMGVLFSASKGKFTLSTGLGKISMSEITNYSREVPVYSYDTSLVLVKRNYGTDKRGKTIALIEERIDSNQSGSNTVVDCPDCETQWSYLKVPLSLQYSKRKNRTSGFVQLGLNLYLAQDASGLYILPENSDLKSNNWQTKNINSSFMQNYASLSLGFGTEFSLTQRFSLWANVHTERAMGSMFDFYDQKYDLVGVRFGLKYRLANIYLP